MSRLVPDRYPALLQALADAIEARTAPNVPRKEGAQSGVSLTLDVNHPSLAPEVRARIVDALGARLVEGRATFTSCAPVSQRSNLEAAIEEMVLALGGDRVQ